MTSARYPGTFPFTETASPRNGESILVAEPASLVRARVTDAHVEVELSDGRRLATPLSWYPILQRASRDALNNLEIWPWGLHWPLLDEDLSLEGMLAGTPGSKPSSKATAEG